MSKDLQDLRQDIDAIDQQLTALFEKRMDLAVEVARCKANQGLDILDSSREQQVIDKNVSRLSQETYAEELADFYNHLMDLSKAVQHQYLES